MMPDECEITELSLVAPVVVLGADEGVDPETTTKNPHLIDIAREKPPLASLTSLTQRGMRARSGRRGAKGRFEERVREKQQGIEDKLSGVDLEGKLVQAFDEEHQMKIEEHASANYIFGTT